MRWKLRRNWKTSSIVLAQNESYLSSCHVGLTHALAVHRVYNLVTFLRVYIFYEKWHYTWQLSVKTVFYFYLRSITYCSCDEKQRTVIPYLIFPYHSWLYGPQLHLPFVGFPLHAKKFQSWKKFQGFYPYSLLFSVHQNKNRVGQDCTHNLRSMHGTPVLWASAASAVLAPNHF